MDWGNNAYGWWEGMRNLNNKEQTSNPFYSLDSVQPAVPPDDTQGQDHVVVSRLIVMVMVVMMMMMHGGGGGCDDQ